MADEKKRLNEVPIELVKEMEEKSDEKDRKDERGHSIDELEVRGSSKDDESEKTGNKFDKEFAKVSEVNRTKKDAVIKIPNNIYNVISKYIHDEINVDLSQAKTQVLCCIIAFPGLYNDEEFISVCKKYNYSNVLEYYEKEILPNRDETFIMLNDMSNKLFDFDKSNKHFDDVIDVIMYTNLAMFAAMAGITDIKLDESDDPTELPVSLEGMKGKRLLNRLKYQFVKVSHDMNDFEHRN